MNEHNILGVVLAGGKSKRFGKDKTEAKLGDKTLLQHTLNKIKNKLSNIVIVSNKKEIEDYKIIKDCIDGQLGPLVGVLSAMKWVKKNNFSYNWIATFPCDTPFFDNSIIDKFKLASESKDSLLYFINTNKQRHNIFGLWSIKLVEILEKDIIKNNYRKVEEWANKIGVKNINVSYNGINPFFNINTNEDLIEANKLFKNYKND